MYRPLTLFIGLRYIFGKNSDHFGRFVSWLSMVGLMLGSMALIIVLSVMNGLEQQMQTSILRFIPQAVVTTQMNRLNPVHDNKESLNHLVGVTAISPLITGDVILQSQKSVAITQLMGIDPNEDDPVAPFIISGTLAELREGEYPILLGASLAAQLQLAVGDKIRLFTIEANKFTPIGRIPNQRLFTVVGFFAVNKDIDQSLAFVNINDAAKLFNYTDNTISGWRLILADPLSIEQLVNQRLPPYLHFNDWRTQRGELFTAIKLEKKMMGLFISLIVIIAAFNIITSLSLLIMEKQAEIAILKTQGLTNIRLMIIFILQGAIAGIVGTMIGTLIGVLIAAHLSAIMTFFHLSIAGISMPTRINPHQIMIITTSLIGISLLATLYPSIRASKTQPAEALRYE